MYKSHMQSVSNLRTQEGWVYPVFNYEVLHEHIRTMEVIKLVGKCTVVGLIATILKY